MRSTFIHKDKKHHSLIVFFAGWGMDEKPFLSLPSNGCDVLVCYDYTDLTPLSLPINEYSTILVFAWSFGVYAASLQIASGTLHPNLAIAINGTMFPIDDTKGIPSAIFDSTLKNLSEESLRKFRLRMCGSRSLFSRFTEHLPDRSLNSLRDELIAVKQSYAAQQPSCRWDKAYISTDDRIFPPENQHRGWKDFAEETISLPGAHLPKDIGDIIAANIIDKEYVRQNFERSLHTYKQNASVQGIIAEHLCHYWESVDDRTGISIYEIGCGIGMLTQLYAQSRRPKNILLTDIADIPAECFSDIDSPHTFQRCDAEYTIPTGKFDVIVTSSTIQWFENTERFLKHIREAMTPGGLLVIATFGKNNLMEVRSVFKSSLNYLSAEKWKSYLSENGYEILHFSEEKIITEFSSPRELLDNLKRTGVNGTKPPSGVTKEMVCQIHDMPKNANGKYQLSYHPIYIIARLKTEQK